MADIYEITRRQLYILVGAGTVVSILLIMLGFVLGRNFVMPEQFSSAREIAGISSLESSDENMSEEIKKLRISNDGRSSEKPFVNDEGLSFYEKLKVDTSKDIEEEKTEKTKTETGTKVEINQKFTEAKLPVPTPSPVADPYATAKPDFKKAYVVQVSSVKRKEYAEETLAKLQKLGYPAYISKIKFKTGIVNYRARVGPYSNRATADKIAARIRKQRHNSPLVMTVKNGER